MALKRNSEFWFFLGGGGIICWVFLFVLHPVACHSMALFSSLVFSSILSFSVLENIPVETRGGNVSVFLIVNDDLFGRRRSGGSNQNWRIRDSSSGHYCLVSLTTSCFLTLGRSQTFDFTLNH